MTGEPGPVAVRVVGRLRPVQPLAGEGLEISAPLALACPSLAGLGAALGASWIDTRAGPCLHIAWPGSPERPGVCLASTPRQGCGAVLATRSLPGHAFLIERWHVDWAPWEQLLLAGDPGALAGKRLLVRGYGERGRQLARRARDAGMRVGVREDDPLLQLAAIHDGFEPADGTETGCEVVRDAAPEEIEAGLAGAFGDELTALGLIGASVAAALFRGPAGEGLLQARWAELTGRLFLDALIAARMLRETDPALWAAVSRGR